MWKFLPTHGNYERKLEYDEGLWQKVNRFPPSIKQEIGAFLDRACNDPYHPSVNGPSITRVDGKGRSVSTLPSGYRVLWTIGSFENQETIKWFGVLPPK